MRSDMESENVIPGVKITLYNRWISRTYLCISNLTLLHLIIDLKNLSTPLPIRNATEITLKNLTHLHIER